MLCISPRRPAADSARLSPFAGKDLNLPLMQISKSWGNKP
jgi:hypothetical protein